MFDFENLSKEELSFMLRSGVNPLTGSRFQSENSEPVIQMIQILHAAINDYEIDIEGHYVFIPGIDSTVEIEEWTPISKLAYKIYYAFYEATQIETYQLSKQNIQNAIIQYLFKNEYLELRESPYSTRDKSYFATDKGEDCGIHNSHGKNNKHKHIVYYSCYMQACIVRKLPEILSYAAILKFNNSHDIVALCNSIEPLSLEEQELISKYRTLNYRNKNLILTTLNTLTSQQDKSSSNKKIL